MCNTYLIYYRKRNIATCTPKTPPPHFEHTYPIVSPLSEAALEVPFREYFYQNYGECCAEFHAMERQAWKDSPARPHPPCSLDLARSDFVPFHQLNMNKEEERFQINSGHQVSRDSPRQERGPPECRPKHQE